MLIQLSLACCGLAVLINNVLPRPWYDWLVAQRLPIHCPMCLCAWTGFFFGNLMLLDTTHVSIDVFFTFPFVLMGLSGLFGALLGTYASWLFRSP